MFLLNYHMAVKHMFLGQRFFISCNLVKHMDKFIFLSYTNLTNLRHNGQVVPVPQSVSSPKLLNRFDFMGSTVNAVKEI
jgi:hypothetical protein